MRDKELGAVLTKWREGLGLTKKALADKCGIDPSAIRNYESGSRPLTLDAVQKMMEGADQASDADALLLAFLKQKFPDSELFN